MILSKKIPYYGKYNSISSIELSEDKLSYLVRRFDNKGKEKKEVFEIANKSKNTKLLFQDYFNDVEEYLTKNKDKYNNYKNKKIALKKDFDLNKIIKLNKISKISLALSTLLIATSFFTTSTITLYYIGLLILIPTSTGVLVLTDIEKEQNIKNFINIYEELEANLIEYTSKEHNTKTTLTEYNGLNKDKNKGNDLKLKKIKTLENKVA